MPDPQGIGDTAVIRGSGLRSNQRAVEGGKLNKGLGLGTGLEWRDLGIVKSLCWIILDQ